MIALIEQNNHMIFGISLLACLIILALSLLSIVTQKFQFWPPPSKSSWQYHTFWSLFRILLVGIVVLSIVDFNSLPFFKLKGRYFLGIPLAVIGFSMAWYVTFYLGWENAHGLKKSLKTKGIYSWSRNPIYVVSILGFLGLSITINSILVYVLIALWTVFYVIAPFLEESWLEKHYGEEFLVYKSKVPRFLKLVMGRNARS